MSRRNFVKRWGVGLSSAALCSLSIFVASGSSPAGAASSGYQSQHAGGTIHLVATAAGGSLDPQINYTLQYWQLYQATYDGLVAFQKVGGDPSFDVVPDLATAMPKVTNAGKTYTFTLRKGIKFSTGKTVTVADVLGTFQRLFKVSSPNSGSWYDDIVGGPACVKTPATCTLKGGVVVNAAANTVVFNLITPDSEFLDQLAVPFGSIIPASTPAKDQGDTPIPGTGAYYFASYNPNSALVMKRNPYFKVWSAAAQPQGYPNEIEMTFGLPVESEVTAVENGQADWIFDPIPADRLGTISTTYASQVHVHSLTADWYAPMNMNIAPFNNLKARQAVNYALNKNSLVKLYGGTELAQPTCTILPPAFPGYSKYCAYNSTSSSTYSGPDLAKAKALVKASGTSGDKVAVVAQNDPVDEAVGEYIQGVLNQIGYKATLKPLSQNIEFNYIQNTNNKVQISVTQWYQDYPAASDFLNVLLNCDEFHKGSDNSINIAGMCNANIDKMMATAETEELTNQTASNAMWGKIDKLIMTTQAPWVPLFNPKLIDFVSKRVGNYQFSLEFYMYVDQLWVK
ncbi:MAG TPA: ABC transporter substrate-binding protein [Acidimicrobiales bacterium]|jgi:peptide/nickel transport system substrate-binding protein